MQIYLYTEVDFKGHLKKIKLVLIHVSFSIFVVTKGKESPASPKLHFPSRKPECWQRQLIKPKCLKVQSSEIQIRRKVVSKQRLKDRSVKNYINSQLGLIRFLLTALEA